VVTTGSGRGALREDHRLALGFDGLRSDPAALNRLFSASDLVLAIGAKLGHNGTAGFGLKLPADRLVHIDASDEVLGANYPASLTLQADAREVLEALLAGELPASGWGDDEIRRWREEIRAPAWRNPEPRLSGLEPARFFEELRSALPDDAVLVLDSGLHQILTRRHFEVLARNGLLFPSDLQSMGFCLPTAIGARLGDPSRPVVALLGDGGFSMSGMEILTAVREKVDLVVLLLVDGQLGQIRMQQLAEFGATHAVALENPDFEQFASAVGARYRLAEQAIGPAVREALGLGGVTLIEIPAADTWAIRRGAVVIRARERVRGLMGPRIVQLIKRLLGRSRQP
jgi:acetolactate synthase-1/2/3 large subunit